MLIFTYGTLKPGKSNNYLLEGQKELGEVVLRIPYEMYSCGGYPALVPCNHENEITGFVFEVDEKTKLSLNRLEGYTGVRNHPSNWYNTADVKTPFGEAELYFFENQPKNWKKINGKF